MPVARPLTSLQLRVFDIGATSPTAVLDGDTVVGSVDLSAAVGQSVGTAQVQLRGADLPLSAVEMGRRVEVYAGINGGSQTQLGTTRIADYEIDLEPGITTVTAELDNFVFSLLRDRQFSGQFRGEPLDAALSRVLEREVPEVGIDIGLTEVPTVTQTFEAVPVLSVVGDLTSEAALVGADDQQLTVAPIPDPASPPTTLTDADLQPARFAVSGSPVTNVRVEGGTVRLPLRELRQPAAERSVELLDDAGTPVRVGTHLTPTRYATLASLDVVTESEDVSGTLICRLHPDADGEPRQPDNPDAAVATRRLDARFVSESGQTTIEWPDHTLESDPHLIITQRQGTEGDSAPFAIRGTTREDGTVDPAVLNVTTPQPVVLEQEDEAASARLGRRDGRVQRDNINSFEEARAVGRRELARRADPEEVLQAQAATDAAHDLSLLDAVSLEQPRLWTGTRPFVVSEKRVTIDSRQLQTELRFTQPPGFDPA